MMDSSLKRKKERNAYCTYSESLNSASSEARVAAFVDGRARFRFRGSGGGEGELTEKGAEVALRGGKNKEEGGETAQQTMLTKKQKTKENVARVKSGVG